MRRHTGPDRSTRDTVYERDAFRCVVGGCSGAVFQVHHRRARGMGGSRRADTNLPANLILLCETCHAYVEAHPKEAAEKGWRIPQGQDPCNVAMWHEPFGEWVFLDNEGGMTVAFPSGGAA